MSQEKQPDTIALANQADTQLGRIDRYLDKNWLDDDYPDDKIYGALAELRRLHAENEQALALVRSLTELLDDGESHTPQCCSNYWVKPCDCNKQTTLNNANAWLADKP